MEMFYNADCLKPIKHDWCYKWSCIPNKTVHETVAGPLIHPMVVIPLPCIFENENDKYNCTEKLKKCYSRRGIPDPWNEYLLVKEGTEKGSIYPNDFPKKDLNITKHLGEKYRLHFGQGIPDPWRRWATVQPAKKAIPEGMKKTNMNNNDGMCKADGIFCPNCNTKFHLFHMSDIDKRGERGGEEGKIENSGEEITIMSKITESASSEILALKDACVGTDELREENKKTKVCQCQDYRSWRIQKLTCACNPHKKESKPKICKCKDDNSRDSGRLSEHRQHSHGRQNYVYTAKCGYTHLPYLTRAMSKEKHRFDLFPFPGNSSFLNEKTSPLKGQPVLLSPQLPNVSTSLPLIQFPARPEHIWFSPGFFCRCDRTRHFLELKWVCRWCEKKKKQKQRDNSKSEHKADSILRKHKYCPYSESKSLSEQSLHFDEGGNNPYLKGIHKISHVRLGRRKEQQTLETPRFHCRKGTSTNGNVFADVKSQENDFIQLLQVLGCKELFKNRLNTNYKEP